MVDASDERRIVDCKGELMSLLKEQRLERASLLVFANKQDVKGARSAERIQEVRIQVFISISLLTGSWPLATGFRLDTASL